MLHNLRILFVLVIPLLLAAGPPGKKAPAQKGFFGVQIRANEKDEILVMKVIPDSPAETAGLQGGDVMLRIGGVKPTTLAAAVRYIGSLKPGKKLKVLIRRDGKEKVLVVEVGLMSDS
jgi:S1-C subfamily serine protease